VSDPGDLEEPHGQRRAGLDQHAIAQGELAALALGEDVAAAVAEHVSSCAQCHHDLRQYEQVAELARAGGRAGDQYAGPPERVWDRIAAELELTDLPAGTAVSAGSRLPARAPRWRARRTLLAAACVAALGVTGAAGWALGRATSGPTTGRASEALLAAQPGTPGDAQGKATVHRSAVGYTLSVSASGLPAPDGYYEVWLFNPSINQMVAVGALGAERSGSFTVPDGLDLSAYHVVDVSAQKYDGNNAHERSVLRGPLAP
jgi:hypothetical protein